MNYQSTPVIEQSASIHQVAGVRLAIKQEGSSGPPLVCLHATGHDSDDFSVFANTVKNAFSVLCIDFPSQGLSGPDTEPASAQRYAYLVETLLDQKRLRSVILVGNSIGGAAAIILTAKRPDLVRALVLSSPGGLEPPTAFTRFAVKMMVRFFKAGEAQRWWFKRAFSLYYRMVLPKAPKRRAEIIANMPRTVSSIREAWESFALPEADLRLAIEACGCPIWFAWSKDDKIVAHMKSESTIGTLPNTTTQLFEGGHSPFLEDTEAFVKGFRSFVQSVEED